MTSLRNYTLFVVVILLCSFNKKEPDYSKTLPGVVKITDYLYYDQTEATNFWWREYIEWNKKTYGENSVEYKAAFPDTNVWIQTGTYNQPYVRYYLDHPAYAQYPVVGITWKQANDFCTWRSLRAMDELKESSKIEKAPKYFTYRLPTYAEWKMMYEDVGKLSIVIGEEGKKANRGMHRFNMKRNVEDMKGQAGSLNDNADVTAPVKSYWPNQYDVYNIKGNVSEWMLEENTHVGGAWNTLNTEFNSDAVKFEGTSAAIGFRCVCEVIEEAP
jgi:formylglycine-generating enzyme required for sulfatase activity